MTGLLPEALWSRPGATLGALLGLGLVLSWTGLPHRRRAGLDERVLPYLRDTPRPSRLLDPPGEQVGGVLGALLKPLMGDLTAGVERLLGGRASVHRRLQRAGLQPDVDRFRAEQVLWGVAGGLAGAGYGVVFVLAKGGSPAFMVLTVAVGVGVGLVSKDYLLSRHAVRREQRMVAEFPTIAELLALSVGAGEGAVGALERVCRLSSGELSSELRRCLAEARAGANLPAALQGLADRSGLPSLTRFVDGIVVAVERGTPLADVLRAQAQDVREEGRRQVMEAGGRKEILMMVPVVFLVLPVTVVFAVYPAFEFLNFRL